MKVRMRVDMSGTREGVPWPPRGAVVDLPDPEAQQYIDADMAVAVGDKDTDVETATMPDDAEKRGGLTTKTGPRGKR